MHDLLAVHATLHSAGDQPDAAAEIAQFDRTLGYVTEKIPSFVEHLDTAQAEILALTTIPKDR